jgi:ankyrin repeat protein
VTGSTAVNNELIGLSLAELNWKLVSAANSGDRATIRQMVSAGAELNMPSELPNMFRKEPPLIEAAKWGRVRSCELLLRLGASIDVIDHLGETALHGAANNHDPLTCAYLLKRGAPLRVLSHMGKTALHSAADADSVAVCRLLIDAGLSMDFVPENARPSYLTPFQVAIARNSPAVVRMYVEHLGGRIDQVTLAGIPVHELAKFDPLRSYLLSLHSTCQIESALGHSPTEQERSKRAFSL